MRFLKLLLEITAQEAKQKYYSDVDDEVYQNVLNIDPTYDPNKNVLGIYSKWMLKPDNIKTIYFWGRTSLEKLSEKLKIHLKMKKSKELPEDFSDLNKISLDYFYKNFNFEGFQSKQEKKASEKENAKKWDLGTWWVINPQSEEASCYYGSGTKWCTNSKKDNKFSSYKELGELYIFIYKTKPNIKYQIYLPSNDLIFTSDMEVADSKDKGIAVSKFFDDYNFQRIKHFIYGISPFNGINISFEIYEPNEMFDIIMSEKTNFSELSGGSRDFLLERIFSTIYKNYNNLKDFNSGTNVLSIFEKISKQGGIYLDVTAGNMVYQIMKIFNLISNEDLDVVARFLRCLNGDSSKEDMIQRNFSDPKEREFLRKNG